MTLSRRLFLFGLAALPLPAHALSDAFGQAVVPRDARRILSLGADITEILARIGCGDRIIARDRSSTFPQEMRALPSVGQRRALSPEGILSVNPDLILAADDIGPPEVVAFLRGQGIPFVTVPHAYSLDGILTKVAILAGTLGVEPAGAALSADIARDYTAAEAISRSIPEAARKRAVFLHGFATLSAAGSGTAAGEILRAAGARNIFADHAGYLSATPELIIARDPEVVVAMPDSTGGPHPEEVFAMAAFSGTTAARNRALLVLEDNLMIGFGPRTAGQIRRLAQALYPG
ncbi:heme/hemin ABC transporter substrate-binding protein [Paenirhodobacter sp.]|uniref:heme/hemin ABC transporter substrate-binding protein n=1 Tax=Paenirhodobacter sp. TaxID=1965326 RepID=UPI003B3EDFA9